MSHRLHIMLCLCFVKNNVQYLELHTVLLVYIDWYSYRLFVVGGGVFNCVAHKIPVSGKLTVLRYVTTRDEKQQLTNLPPGFCRRRYYYHVHRCLTRHVSVAVSPTVFPVCVAAARTNMFLKETKVFFCSLIPSGVINKSHKQLKIQNWVWWAVVESN